MSDLVQPHVVTVSGSDGLMAALQGAQAGDTILLAPGTYSAIYIGGLHFDGAVTIQSADPAHQAVLNGITFDGSSGLALNNVDVAVNGSWAKGVTVMSSANISMSGLTVHGVTGVDEGVGVSVRNSQGITVSSSDFTKVGSGIGFADSSNLTFAHNTFHDLETDGIFGGGSSHVVVDGNAFSDFHPMPGDHPDAIQFFAGTGGVHGSDITVSNNVITRGAGEVIQGIFVEATDNITIVGNAMTGTAYNGISLSTTSGALVQDNFVQGFADMGSRIITRGESSNVTVTHNTSESVVTYNDDGMPLPNYVATDNTIIPAAAINDLSTINDWLSKHVGTPLVAPSPVTTPVVTPVTTPVGPGGLDLSPTGIDHLVQQAIADQLHSLSLTNGWVML